MAESIISPALLIGKISRKSLRLRKTIYQQVKSFSDSSYLRQRKILFIVGCQRSGTTLLEEVFEKDANTKVYGESSKLSSIEGLRLNPLDAVKRELQKVKAQLIIMKPLVESQNIIKLLGYFENSKALWIYRDFKDVAASNLKMFGRRNGIEDIRPITQNLPDNWRSEGASENIRQIVLKYFSEDMNPYDAAVLFWYSRNELFFDLGLDTRNDVLICKYEDLVRFPNQALEKIYCDLGQEFPGKGISKDVHLDSLRKGKDIGLSPAVEDLANDLLDRLNKTYASHSPQLPKQSG